jgi:dimethylhistidine N-methyltransferase
VAVQWNTFGDLKGFSCMTTYSPAFDLERSTSLNSRAALVREVQRGLHVRPRSLAPWMFYDAHGSRIFERITQLPEYYLTRTELSILASSSDSMIAAARSRRAKSLRLLELGAGTASKTDVLLDAVVRLQGDVLYVPVDVSLDALEVARERINSTLPEVSVEPIVANYVMDPLRLEAFDDSTLALYLGSSIGNFSPDEARTILHNLGSQLRSGDALLIGIDLVKDESILEAAYDDKDGVTAEFNLNILSRLNRELGADFDPASFCHRALWNRVKSRIEMHLESTRDQHVRIPAAHLDLHFAAGETIHTENSYKFSRETIRILLQEAGFAFERAWTDVRGWYSVTLARLL